MHIYISLISNLRPLAKGFDLVKGCSLAKGSHGPSSSSCWAWHQPPRAAFWCGHDKSCSPREAPRPGGGPVGAGCPAMVAELVHRPQLVLGLARTARAAPLAVARLLLPGRRGGEIWRRTRRSRMCSEGGIPGHRPQLVLGRKRQPGAASQVSRRPAGVDLVWRDRLAAHWRPSTLAKG